MVKKILICLLLACGPSHLVSLPDSGLNIANELDGSIPNIQDAGCFQGYTAACYNGPANTENVGACHGGVIYCQPNGILSGCLGEVLPQAQDNCSGQDVDCDGIVNNLPIQVCYTGDGGLQSPDLNCAGTNDGCPCRTGVISCLVDGGEFCQNEVTPQPNVCGEGDLACNGKGGLVTSDLINIAFYIDDTGIGSEDYMGAYYNYALQAIQQFVAEYPQSNFRYAIILLPGPNGLAIPPNEISIEQFFNPNDFEDAGGTEEQTLKTIDGLPQQVSTSANEPFYNLDILYGSIHPLTNVDWQPGARQIVVMFEADESEGSILDPENDETITNISVANLYKDAGASLVLFVASLNYYTFGCGGPVPSYCITFLLNQSNVFPISGASEMVDELNQTLSFPCNKDGG